MLSGMLQRGHQVALLLVDTRVYVTAPAAMLDEDSRPYANPSALVYVDGSQLNYVRSFSEKELEFIESVILIGQDRLMKRSE